MRSGAQMIWSPGRQVSAGPRQRKAIPDRHLVRIGTTLVPEPLHVNDNNGPVNGQRPVLHPSPPARPRQKRSSGSLQAFPRPDRKPLVSAKE